MSDSEGQVSEAENLRSDQPDTPIADDQSTGGYPDSESGGPDEGPQGPNSNPHRDPRNGEPAGPGEAADPSKASSTPQPDQD
jgi:hypothetical protein